MSDKRIVEFGRRIRAIRRTNKLSQEKLAALADLDRSYMGKVERGEKNLSIKNVFRIADALGVSAASLFQ